MFADKAHWLGSSLFCAVFHLNLYYVWDEQRPKSHFSCNY